MDNDFEYDVHNISMDDVEKAGEGIGAAGVIFGGVAALIGGIVALCQLFSGKDDKK